MDSIDPKSINGLIGDGERLYAENQEEVEKFLRVLIDEKFAPQAPPPAPAPAPTPAA
jgi:hypothetical protein